MKPILIFFIPLIMMGQESDWGLLTATSQYDSIKGKSDVEFALLRILEEYEAECYADSTEVKEHITNGTPCIGTSRGFNDFTCNSPNHYNIKVWVHKESGIPKGFIEFLRSKN